MEKGKRRRRRGKCREKDERDERSAFPSAGLHIGETIQNTWTGLPMIPRWLQCRMPQFHCLVHFSLWLSLSLLLSLISCLYALTPQLLCRSWAWMLTDAGWGCRAQLGLIAAVYLIKTWEDPTGASAREDTATIYRFEHRYTHTSTSRGEQGRQETRCFPLSLETRYILQTIWL